VIRGSGGSQAALQPGPGAHVATRGRERVLLTSFDWTGAPAQTPVRVAFAGGRAYVRVSARNPLLERVWNHPRVSITPCGKEEGPAVEAEARVLAPHEQGVAERAFASASVLSSCLMRGLSAVGGLELLYVELR
jgi:PPOX class probable F420-dependent enzyme